MILSRETFQNFIMNTSHTSFDISILMLLKKRIQWLQANFEENVFEEMIQSHCIDL